MRILRYSEDRMLHSSSYESENALVRYAGTFCQVTVVKVIPDVILGQKVKVMITHKLQRISVFEKEKLTKNL